MRIFIGLLGVAALIGCTNVNHTPATSMPSPITTTDRAHLQRDVLDYLKDPLSAQIRNLRAYQLAEGHGRVICGELNAKNSFGDYIGFRNFYLRIRDGETVSHVIPPGGDDDMMHDLAEQACRDVASGRIMIDADAAV